MEENGKKWKKMVVDVQIEGVLVRSCLDGDIVIMVENFILIDLVLIVGIILYGVLIWILS